MSDRVKNSAKKYLYWSLIANSVLELQMKYDIEKCYGWRLYTGNVKSVDYGDGKVLYAVIIRKPIRNNFGTFYIGHSA